MNTVEADELIAQLNTELDELTTQRDEKIAEIAKVRLKLFESQEYKTVEAKFYKWLDLEIGQTEYGGCLSTRQRHNGFSKNSKKIPPTTFELFEYDEPPLYPERRMTLNIKDIGVELSEPLETLKAGKKSYSTRNDTLKIEHYREWMTWLMAANLKSVYHDW